MHFDGVGVLNVSSLKKTIIFRSLLSRFYKIYWEYNYLIFSMSVVYIRKFNNNYNYGL